MHRPTRGFQKGNLGNGKLHWGKKIGSTNATLAANNSSECADRSQPQPLVGGAQLVPAGPFFVVGADQGAKRLRDVHVMFTHEIHKVDTK